VPVIVDDTGAVAYAAPEGAVGVIDPAGIVMPLDNLCTRSFRTRGVTSLTTGGPGALIVTCATGGVYRIVHGDAP
jgi:hypothetical protein